MIEVVVYDNLEAALKRFNNHLKKDGLMAELKNRSYFLTRTQRRKRKDRRAEARRRKRTAKTLIRSQNPSSSPQRRSKSPYPVT